MSHPAEELLHEVRTAVVALGGGRGGAVDVGDEDVAREAHAGVWNYVNVV